MELDRLNVGETYTKSEVENIFDTSFLRNLIPHINTRRDDQNNRYAILFASEGQGVTYPHEVNEDHVRFVGEGEGDQKLNNSRHAALIDSIDDPYPIFLFHKEILDADWEFRGNVQVQDYTFETVDDRRLLFFELTFVENPDLSMLSEEEAESTFPEEELRQERDQIQRELLDKPSLTDPIEYSTQRRKRRDHVFRELVIEAYKGECAVCGSARKTPSGNPEAEAAHIYPKHAGGSDDPRNGIALCKLHHWAYDVGWFKIREDYTVVVREMANSETYNEFKDLDGREILEPNDSQLKPHEVFLQAEQSRHNFY